MSVTPFRQLQFIKSALKLSDCPPDLGNEIAFAGRSNAGKSSLLNALCERPLARTSKTPGRTQCLNFFQFNKTCRWVDLPGYGYAKVSHALRENWQKWLMIYLNERQSLQYLLLLMDIRHPFKAQDLLLLEGCQAYHLPCQIILTKADKLSREAQLKCLAHIKKHYPEFSTPLVCSSLTKVGLAELRDFLLTLTTSMR